jgi:hypothetical protein
MTDEKKDDFDAMFDQAAHEAERTPEQVAADTAAAEKASAAAAAAAETPEAKAAKEAADKAAADEAARVAAEAAAAAETPEAKVAREAAEKVAADATAKAAADEAARAAAAAAVETPEAKAAKEKAEADAKAAREALEASIAPYQPDEKERAALAQFEKEFPGEYMGVMAKFKEQDRKVNRQVYDAVQGILKEYTPRLATVEATVTETAVDRHFNTIKAAHADFDATAPKVAAWIKTQPAYLQPAMQAVYDQGAAADVVALFSDYKKATGITVVDPAAEAAAREAAEKAAAAKARGAAGAEDLAPVGSRRSTAAARGAPDKNDYAGAWAELEKA